MVVSYSYSTYIEVDLITYWNIRLNSGLKCYDCEGYGRDDPCMLGRMNDTSISIVTCEPNEFCHIERTVTMINVTTDSNGMFKSS